MVGSSPGWLSALSQLDKLRAAHSPIAIAGEAGTGKSTLALGVPYRSASIPPNFFLVDAADRHIVGTREWLTELRKTAESGCELVIRGIETLDSPTLDGMRSIMELREGKIATILTLTTTEQSAAEQIELRFGAQSVWTPPLRERTMDIPELWRALRNPVAPGLRLAVDEEASKLIEAYHWPGNIKELRQLVSQLASTTRSGPVTASELPPTMHAGRNLTLIERVELGAIRKALQVADGNRVKAADILGLSRATVYRKMKAYRLAR